MAPWQCQILRERERERERGREEEREWSRIDLSLWEVYFSSKVSKWKSDKRTVACFCSASSVYSLAASRGFGILAQQCSGSSGYPGMCCVRVRLFLWPTFTYALSCCVPTCPGTLHFYGWQRKSSSCRLFNCQAVGLMHERWVWRRMEMIMAGRDKHRRKEGVETERSLG